MTGDIGKSVFENTQDIVASKWSIEGVGDEVIAHIAWSLSFTIGRSVTDVWRYLKDFNLWLEDLQYNCVVGDAKEGETVYFTIKEASHEHYRSKYGFDPKEFKKTLIVRRNEPEKLIVWEELSRDRRSLIAYYLWALSGSGGKTAVSGIMSYAPHWDKKANEPQLRTSYQSLAADVSGRWKNTYIPRLRQLLEG
jgi:hypothetical protein